MLENVNISKLFVETHNEIISKYKNNNGKIRTHFVQQRYLDFLDFIKKEVYWSRHNMDHLKTDSFKKNINIKSKKIIYLGNTLTGKYLNELHIYYTRHNFYYSLYKKLLDIWFKLTDYITLSSVSQDSSFVRNINGINCKRNPQYYNKPGIKAHVISDSLRVPISFAFSDCTVHDSHYVSLLLKNKLIDHITFCKYNKSFLADSAYSTLLNIHNVTNLGVNIIMGRNKQHISKSTIVCNITDDKKKKYNKRTTVENFFGNIERYPCILNNYEKTLESYSGLFIFVCCINLFGFEEATQRAKKINILIAEKNNILIKEKHEADLIKSNKEASIRKQLKYVKNKNEKELRELKKKKNDMENNRILKKINENIKKYIDVDKFKIKKKYNKKIKNLKKITCKFNYETYHKKAINEIIEYVRNNVLMITEKFKFANKYTFIITAEKNVFNEEVIKEKFLNNFKAIDQKLQKFTNEYFNINSDSKKKVLKKVKSKISKTNGNK